MRRLPLIPLSLGLLPLLLAGCQTWGPTWSEVSGQRYYVTQLNTSPTIIENIDGSSAFPNAPGQPIKIDPGKHRVVLQAIALSGGWSGGTELNVYELNAEPCKRYYINALFENPLGREWKTFIDYVETVPGCLTPDQVKK